MEGKEETVTEASYFLLCPDSGYEFMSGHS